MILRRASWGWPALALALALGCDEPEAAPPAEVVRPVRVVRVETSGGVQSRTFSGVAKAGAESRLSFKVAGTLSDLDVKVGDDVKKGARIAAMEGTDFALKVEEAKASVDQAQAQQRNAKAQYERTKTLYENNNASAQDLDAARTAEESARALVAASKKRLALTRSQASYTSLNAPVDGRIAQVLAEKGENVQAGQAIAIINSGNRAEITIPVSESLIAKVPQAGAAEVTFGAIEGVKFKATITEVGVASVGTATTYPVVVRLDEEDERVRSGMAAEVSITFGSDGEEKAIYLPPKAVGEDRDGRFAFVAVPAEEGFATVQRRKLETGEIGSNGLRVLSGVEDGDLLITAGMTYLEDGLRVRLPSR